MKTLSFHECWNEKILSGEKTGTFRPGVAPKYSKGDIVAATNAKPGKPGFLTPAKDRFATLRVVERTAKLLGYKSLTAEELTITGATLEWYDKNSKEGFGWLYEFELVEEVEVGNG